MAPRRLRKAELVICNYPGCRVLTKGKYCKEHGPSPAKKRERDPFLDSAEWRKLRAVKAAETPWCEECLAKKGVHVPMVDVDHIKPRHTFPQLALVYSNLRSLCLPCHGRKTGRGE